jgi:purine-binding chemotaxis protein CheW
MQALTFSVKGETYAVPIRSIKEILEFGSLTTVPMMPRFVRGVMNLRGSVIPVIDLAARFQQGHIEPTLKTCVVIFEVAADDGMHTLGVMVDWVSEVLEIAEGQIDPPPSFGTRIAPEFIRGMGRMESRIVILLDLDRVLSVEQMEHLAAA